MAMNFYCVLGFLCMQTAWAGSLNQCGCKDALAAQKLEYDARMDRMQQQIDRLTLSHTDTKQMNDVVGFMGSPSTDRYYGNVGDHILFDKIDFNAGNAFDGIYFTCPQTGMYLFSLSARGSHNNIYEPAMYRNGERIAQVTSSFETGYWSGDGITVVTQCNVGDIVHVEIFYIESNQAFVIHGY